MACNEWQAFNANQMAIIHGLSVFKLAAPVQGGGPNEVYSTDMDDVFRHAISVPCRALQQSCSEDARTAL